MTKQLHTRNHGDDEQDEQDEPGMAWARRAVEIGRRPSAGWECDLQRRRVGLSSPVG